MTVSSFIIVGYVCQILGRRGQKEPPIRQQPQKSPSLIGLTLKLLAYNIFLEKQLISVS